MRRPPGQDRPRSRIANARSWPATGTTRFSEVKWFLIRARHLVGSSGRAGSAGLRAAGLRVGLGVRLRVRLSRRSLISRVRRLGVRVGGLGLAGHGVGELESSAHPSPPPPPGRLVTQSVPPECLPAALFLNCRLPRWRPLLFSGLRRCPVRHRRGLAQLRARARARAVASAGPCTSSFSSET